MLGPDCPGQASDLILSTLDHQPKDIAAIGERTEGRKAYSLFRPWLGGEVDSCLEVAHTSGDLGRRNRPHRRQGTEPVSTRPRWGHRRRDLGLRQLASEA